MMHKREPVEDTCPKIDRLICSLKTINTIIKGCNKEENLSELKSQLDNMQHIMRNWEDELEDIRLANWSLRFWGREEASKVDKLEKEMEKTE